MKEGKREGRNEREMKGGMEGGEREKEREREREREREFLSKRVRTGKYDTELLTFYTQRSGNLSQMILKAWILWQRLN